MCDGVKILPVGEILNFTVDVCKIWNPPLFLVWLMLIFETGWDQNSPQMFVPGVLRPELLSALRPLAVRCAGPVTHIMTAVSKLWTLPLPSQSPQRSGHGREPDRGASHVNLVNKEFYVKTRSPAWVFESLRFQSSLKAPLLHFQQWATGPRRHEKNSTSFQFFLLLWQVNYINTCAHKLFFCPRCQWWSLINKERV